MQYANGSEQFPEIRLKLLENNNVIVVQCTGFEPETFMPAIIDGRLSIINIVPQRRCRCINTNFIVAKKSKIYNDTKKQKSFNVSRNSSNSSDLQASTPDQMRNNVAPSIERHTSFPQWSKTRKSLQFGIVERSNDLSLEKQIQNDQTIDQISICRVEPFSENSSNSQEIPEGNLSNMEWPFTENEKSLSNSESFLFFSAKSEPLPKWPKRWLTPSRTYSKQKYTPARVSEKFRKNSFISPTEGVKSEANVVQLKHKNNIIIDRKLKISPRSFKNQFQYKKTDESYIELKMEHSKRGNEVAKKSAYELFTTPTCQSNFSHKLQKQFRDRCTNKAQSTYPKYKKLAMI